MSEERDSERREDEGLLESAPALARLALGTGPRTARWAAETSLRTGGKLLALAELLELSADVDYPDRVPAYLNNLYRLGLIWFSRERLEDPLHYRVLEAQPDVIDAKRRGGRAKTVRRSILPTPFGEDFCRVCQPLT